MLNNNSIYMNDLERTAKNISELEKFRDKSFFITGATGLICSYLIDLLMVYNKTYNGNIKIVAVGRSLKRGNERFSHYFNDKNFSFYEHDIINAIQLSETFDYIIHGASNANPIAYSEDPVGTMLSNIIGMKNILEFSRKMKKAKVLYISSGEVYGESSSNCLKENDYGYIDILNTRSCYPSSKRATETLCVSYGKQYSIKTMIARPCHIYGPTAINNDYRASNQFIQNGVNKKDIILKSSGSQIRSYCYVGDCVSGLLKILLCGELGEAYNISSEDSTVSIRELAKIIAQQTKTDVIFSAPEKKEKEGYSVFSKAVMDNTKLKKLGWSSKNNINNGIKRTIEILTFDYKLN